MPVLLLVISPPAVPNTCVPCQLLLSAGWPEPHWFAVVQSPVSQPPATRPLLERPDTAALVMKS
jgi:hypothetical protein